MNVPTPHFLLYSESTTPNSHSVPNSGWRFVLESLDGTQKIEANDSEPRAHGERQALLAAVRGLEALDQPSRVLLLTPSRYVARGISHGLAEWRANKWKWERYGRKVPVKNQDLWQRVDRAMHFHNLECRRCGSLWKNTHAADPATADQHLTRQIVNSRNSTTKQRSVSFLTPGCGNRMFRKSWQYLFYSLRWLFLGWPFPLRYSSLQHTGSTTIRASF